MESWPPPPTIGQPEPNLEFIRAKKQNLVGSAALICSAIAVLIRVLVFFKIQSGWVGGLSLLLAAAGLVLGLQSRSTLTGRLALLGPAVFLGLLVYYMMRWYGI